MERGRDAWRFLAIRFFLSCSFEDHINLQRKINKLSKRCNVIIIRMSNFFDSIHRYVVLYLARIWRGHVLWPFLTPSVTFLDRFQTVSKLWTRPLIDKRRTRVAPPNRSLPVACSRTVEQSTRAFVKWKSFFDSVFNRVECTAESDGWPRNGWSASIRNGSDPLRNCFPLFNLYTAYYL